MPSYRNHFRKIAILADKITVGGPEERVPHTKRVNDLSLFLSELEQFTDTYRQAVDPAPRTRNPQPDDHAETASDEMLDLCRGRFLLTLEIFAHMTMCRSDDVVAALTFDYEEIYTDIKHFPNIADDRLHLDILSDLIEETAAYLEMLETGKRRVHTPISKYLDSASMRSPYPASYTVSGTKAPDPD